MGGETPCFNVQIVNDNELDRGGSREEFTVSITVVDGPVDIILDTAAVAVIDDDQGKVKL